MKGKPVQYSTYHLHSRCYRRNNINHPERSTLQYTNTVFKKLRFPRLITECCVDNVTTEFSDTFFMINSGRFYDLP